MQGVNILEEIRYASNDFDAVTAAQALIDSGKNDIAGIIKDHKDDILSKKAIKKTCIKFRMRLLTSKRFKSTIPDTAIARAKSLEEQYQTKFNLMLVAPAELFELDDPNKDPILLAELDDDHYLYIAQWGGDMELSRSLRSWPFRNIATIAATVTIAAVLLASLIVYLTGTSDAQSIFACFFALWIGSIAITLYSLISFSISPSSLNWSSEYQDF